MGPAIESLVASDDMSLGLHQRSVSADFWSRAASTVSFGSVLLLLLAAPFEAKTAWLRLSWQSVSSLEVVVLLACVVWAATLLRAGALPLWRTPLTMPGVLLLVVLTVASVAAPGGRQNALHMAGRLACVAVLCGMTLNGVTTLGRARRVLLVASVSGTLAAALVALDYSGLSIGQHMLGAFRSQTTTVGAQVRASGSFQYPTITSMFLEITFACAVGLLPLVWGQRLRPMHVALVASVLVMAAGVTLTLTRAGFVTMASTLAIVTVQRVRAVGVDRSVLALVGVAVAVVVIVPILRSTEDMRLRWTSEHQEAWYRAEIQAPLSLELPTGGQIVVPVTVKNAGRITWDSAAPAPIRFSYHWLHEEDDRVVSWEGLRALFPAPVAPGQRVRLEVPLEAPRQPGTYRVVWDIEQQGHLWFSTEPDALLTMSRAVVRGPAIGGAVPTGPFRLMPMPAARPGRALLWTAALRMLAERPWLGVGPDNFRLRYGPYAGLARPDERVHTNNMYLELLVGGGMLGGLALVWLVWRCGRTVVSALEVGGDPTRTAVRAAVAAAVCAVALHGLVDSFLGFTPTYVTIGIMLGLLLASTGDRHPYAHRV